MQNWNLVPFFGLNQRYFVLFLSANSKISHINSRNKCVKNFNTNWNGTPCKQRKYAVLFPHAWEYSFAICKGRLFPRKWECSLYWGHISLRHFSQNQTRFFLWKIKNISYLVFERDSLVESLFCYKSKTLSY